MAVRLHTGHKVAVNRPAVLTVVLEYAQLSAWWARIRKPTTAACTQCTCVSLL